MPFITAALGDAKESSPVPEGVYPLRIVKHEVTKTKGDSGKSVRDMVVVDIRVEDPNYPNASLVREYLVHALANDTPEVRNLMNLQIRRVLEVFGIPYEDGGYNTDDLQGATGECLLRQEQIQPTDGRPAYTVNRLEPPRLKDES